MAPRRDHILRIDLSSRSTERERIPDSWRRKYVGGKGLGARYLYDELSPNADPMGPRNVLLFMVGPLTGYLPGSQRYVAVTRSPLTGTFLDSYAGGNFPNRLAGALADTLGLLVTGGADEPVRIDVADGEAKIHSADGVWGLDTIETDAALEGSVACIGPAGERGVVYATISSDGAEHHAGRGGAGAVMGSKHLKAVVAHGSPPQPTARLQELAMRDREAVRTSETGRWQAASETLESVDFADHVDALASRGWSDTGFEGVEDIGINAVRRAARGRERSGSVPGGFRFEGDTGETIPRGATTMSLGAGLGIDSLTAVAALGERCNRLGLDLIDTGNAVAWAIRAAEEGIIDRDVSFGNPAEAEALIEEIARRSSPLGDVLAAGVPAAEDRYGGHDLIPTVKAMALPSYDPRGAASMAIAYATSDRGACHRRAIPIEREALEGEWDPVETARAVVAAQNERSLRWSLIADDVTGTVITDGVGEWLEAIDHPLEDPGMTGEVIWNLVRMFNTREGFNRDDDALPDWFADQDEFDRDVFERSLDAYYDIRGWNLSGIPTHETLERLGLLAVADEDTPIGEFTTDSTN